MLTLPEVTLVAVSSVEIEKTDLALRISSYEINFGSIKFLTSEPWVSSDPRIETLQIPKLDRYTYSRFILNNLIDYVETQFCLVVQADGFVLNANRWNYDFLNYDYTGAPWPIDLKIQSGDLSLNLNLTKNSVGNGGFSLRSRRLLAKTKNIDFENLSFPSQSEDLILCHYLYDEMVKAGIKFPTPEIAASFSVESADAAYGQNPKTSFGFHGKDIRDLIFKSIFSQAK
jgi:hypothetical protein